jgi:hypothetical protein
VSEQQQPEPPSEETPASLDGLRERIAARGEEAIGRLTQDLLENPWVNSALAAAFEARGKASEAQELVLELLNLPSAAQIERLTRRVRAVSQRLEAIEEGLMRLEDSLRGAPPALAARLDSIEEQLADVLRELGEMRGALPDPGGAVSPGQERLRVDPPAAGSAGA